MKYIYFVFAYLFISIVFGLTNPQSVSAAARHSGYIRDIDNNGINGAEVKLINSWQDCPEDSDCVTRNITRFATTKPEPETGKQGYYTFNDEDDAGTIRCRSTFSLEVKLPGSDTFVPIQGTENQNSSNILGVSVAHAAEGTQECRTVTTPLPCRIVGNVADGPCSKTETICKDTTPSPSPSPTAPSPSPSLSPSPSPSPVPACAGVCDLSSGTACQGAGYLPGCVCVKQADNSGQCQSCPTGTTYNPVTKTCNPPAACNTDCTGDTKSCESAKDGCTSCVGTPNGPKTCQACPTGTTYNPSTFTCEGPTCNQACDPTNNTCEFNRDGNACQFCNPSSSKCEVCPAGSEFNPETKSCDYQNACKCDGLSFSPSIFPGQLVRFTATSKIEGTAVKNASQKYIVFKVFEPTTGENEAKVLAQSGFIIPTKTEESATRKKYVANWDYRIPFNIKYNATYRVIAYTGNKIDGQALCEAANVTTNAPVSQSNKAQNTAVLAATATSCGNLPSWLCGTADWWKCANINLFKDASTKDYCASLNQASQEVAVDQSTSATPELNKNLQLDSIAPAKTEKNGCNTILFKFDQLK